VSPGPALPPFPPLADASRRLAAAAIPHALGASGLLCAHGLADHARDWDVTVEADRDDVEPLFADLAPRFVGSSGVHADSKLVLHGGTVELILRFAFVVPGGIVRVPTLVDGTWRGIPLGALEAWAAAYALLGRAEKSARVFARLAERGARPEALAALLSQPLPAELAARLLALPPAGGTARAGSARGRRAGR
jgi:hypothetical protein